MLRDRKDKIAEELGKGACIDSHEGYCVASGRYQEIEDLLNMTYEDMKGEI